jgi:hypothetical protein
LRIPFWEQTAIRVCIVIDWCVAATRLGMSPTDQYRHNAADFLSLASKAGDSCQASHFIDMALYWFNMAEKIETGTRMALGDSAVA